MQSNELQELHAPIDIEIVQLLLSVIPDGWYSIRLDVDHVGLDNDEDEFPMSISNNEGRCEIVLPPDELYEKIATHMAIFNRFGAPWRKLVYNIFFDELSEDWRYTIDYEY